MPTMYAAAKNRTRPWQAKVQLEGKTYWLGTYQHRYTALHVEEEFKRGLREITRQAHELWRWKYGVLNAGNG